MLFESVGDFLHGERIERRRELRERERSRSGMARKEKAWGNVEFFDVGFFRLSNSNTRLPFANILPGCAAPRRC